MFSYLNFALAVIFLALLWMFTKIKKIYSKLYKKNTRIPDIEILKKIIPPSADIGWKIKTVCNGVPIWWYKGKFTFAPNSIVATRALLQEKSARVLQELVNIKTFSALFPEYPALKIEKSNSATNQDVVSLSNVNTSLSLTSIVTCHLSHVNFTLERFWFNGPNMSWLYMCPTSMLLSEKYGYWICFVVRDMDDNNGSMLYILGSYPSSVHFEELSQMLSSCLVLTKEHIESVYLQKLTTHTHKENTNMRNGLKNYKNKSRTPSPNQLHNHVNRNSPILKPTPKHISTPRHEAVGYVEEPAVIKKIASTESISEETKENGEKTQQDEEVSNQAAVPVLSESWQEKEKVEKQQIDEKLLKYKDVLKKGFDVLIEANEADENTEGWHNVGYRDGVHVYRKDADKISASGCYKGTTEIKVPFDYLLNYILNIDYKNEYDNLFDKGADVEILGDGLTKIVHLQYQNVWPTTGRDFCSISALRHIKDNLYGVMVTAVTHPDCPPIKSKVRGEVIIGGFLVEELSVDPPLNKLTYVARAELKGSIPQRIINRVSAEQPMFAASIRKHVERRYELQDPSREGLDFRTRIHAVPSILKQLEEEVSVTDQTDFESSPDKNDESELLIETNDENVEQILDNNTSTELDGKKEIDPCEEQKNAPVSDTVQLAGRELETQLNNTTKHTTVLSSGFNIEENYYSRDNLELVLPPRINDDDSLINDTESIGDLSQVEFTEDLHTQISVSEQELELPRDPSGQIDFITLGNQTAASLEQEFFSTRNIIPSSIPDISDSPKDTWVYQGTSKDIMILRKIHQSQKYHSFLGRGIINVLPVTVWEAIRNPTTRFIYDNMLKRNTIVKEISERHRIIHMRHETHACFVKQARDFCILTVERVEQQRYVLAAVSVNIPECPPVRDCVRGRVISSGWIVEPIYMKGKSCSRVTYISQVDFGGRLPTRLINFIAKRQPLALAYLRDYLESAEI